MQVKYYLGTTCVVQLDNLLFYVSDKSTYYDPGQWKRFILLPTDFILDFILDYITWPFRIKQE